ncbi:unnamed protein product [Symbiodinium sp. CCMP2592]|nr:unnamed protein product [Symbiodinium sp. CCMP2592]
MARRPWPRRNWLQKTLQILCLLLLCIWFYGMPGDPLNFVDEEAMWDSIFSQDAAVETIPQVLATYDSRIGVVRSPAQAPLSLLIMSLVVVLGVPFFAENIDVLLPRWQSD